MPDFWHRLEKVLAFDKTQTLFIDDTEEILRTARTYGIRHLLLKTHANSQKPDIALSEFPILRDFQDLISLL
jgi:putative hydrolase of the HAD superfamily